MSSDEEHLLAPFEYIRKMPGKLVRSRLALAFNEWLRIEDVKLVPIMEIVEMLHNASLMVDDIEDGSVLRRGLPVTHSIYGIPRTINTANYIYFIALSKCLALDHPEATRVFSELMLELHRGQGKEIYWRDTVQCPTEEEYEKMVEQKTGGLFSLAVRLMQIFSKHSMDLSCLLQRMALFFQIRDDFLNLTSDEMTKQKTFAEDLTEGKFSFPLIRAIRSHNSVDDEVLSELFFRESHPPPDILRQRTTDYEVKRYCVKVVSDREALKYTLERLLALSDEIRQEIQRLGGNDKLLAVLDFLMKDLPLRSPP